MSETQDGTGSPQELVERALAEARTGTELVAIADEHSAVNLRWAGNTLTTNGVASTRGLTIVAIDRRHDGTSGVGVVARSGALPGEVADIVDAARAAARSAPPADDAGDLATPERSSPQSRVV